MEKEGEGEGFRTPVRVLVLPYPVHGHLNPMLQFAKRLASKGLRVTLAPTIFMAKSVKIDGGPVVIEPISDGYDKGGYEDANDVDLYIERLSTGAMRSLTKLVEKHQHSSNTISCIVYDSFIPWALDVAHRFGLRGAAFFTQSCAVDAIYFHVYQRHLILPLTDESVSLPALPVLEILELPTMVSRPESYPRGVLDLFIGQFSNLDRVDLFLLNSFDKLEDEVVKWIAQIWPCKTIGPTLPSAYLDKSIEGDVNYGITLYDQNADCMKWLDTRETGSVVYISFGSLAALKQEQMEELAWSLRECSSYFLWVVRASEEDKVPNKFKEETQDKGLIVKWCPQLAVLAHSAIGCFVTHCGWNSTLEALSLGVPLVGVPQWTDQPTNAKYVEEVWRVGLRARVDERGIVRREEMEHCIKEVMEGETGREMKRNASKWKVLAEEAMSPGGSSYKNIEEFVATISNV